MKKLAKAPLVSLISPTYKAEQYLADFLHSVLMQDYDNIEFILINDGSDDNSASIIQDYAIRFEQKGINFHYIKKDHAGQAQAFNTALPLVNGEFLTWADSDDLLHPQNISAKVAYMQRHPQCAMLRSNALEFNDDGLILQKSRHSANLVDKQCLNIFDKLFKSKTYCLAGCYMLKTELFRKCYPKMQIPDSIVGQNLQLLLPAASRVECHYLDRVLLSYRRHIESHHHSQRGVQKTSARIKAMVELLLTLLPYCQCDAEHYKNIAHGLLQSFWLEFRSNLPKNVIKIRK